MSKPEEVVWAGRYLTAKRRGRWEYVGRTGGMGAAVVLALDDGLDGRHVLLVEQYRAPLDRRCLELPAGLVGDETEGEAAEAAAARELEEETGWRAGRLERLGEFWSSPGMVAESFTLFRATELERVGEGGGVEGEDIAVHRVPLSRIDGFVADRRAAGVAVDVKLLALLGGDLLGRA